MGLNQKTPQPLNIFTDERAPELSQKEFLIGGIAIRGDAETKRIKLEFESWLTARRLHDTPGRKWPAECWKDFAQFIIRNRIFPLCSLIQNPIHLKPNVEKALPEILPPFLREKIERKELPPIQPIHWFWVVLLRNTFVNVATSMCWPIGKTNKITITHHRFRIPPEFFEFFQYQMSLCTGLEIVKTCERSFRRRKVRQGKIKLNRMKSICVWNLGPSISNDAGIKNPLIKMADAYCSLIAKVLESKPDAPAMEAFTELLKEHKRFDQMEKPYYLLYNDSDSVPRLIKQLSKATNA